MMLAIPSGVKKARPRCRIHQDRVNLLGRPRSSTLIHETRSSPSIHRRPESAAHLDRSDTPAIPGMHAPLHHVAAAIARVGVVVVAVVRITVIAIVVVKCTERESAPVVE